VKKFIYIVLTDTGTLLSKAIGMYTGKELNHTSIAFDNELIEMYSFGRKQPHNPFVGGFVKESATEGIFRQATCAVYRCEVTAEDYVRMLEKIRLIEQEKELYKYNFIGLFGVAVNKGIQREHAFFCSQFVAMVVNEGNLQMFNIAPSLVQPHHFSQLPCLERVFEGDLQTYLDQTRGQQERAPIRMGMWKSLAFRLLA
jgi:hypothetical protein